MGVAWGGVHRSEGLPQCGISPRPRPQLPQPHQTWPHCQAHFRDGWKFPFQQNPFVKPWSFEPRSALPAWRWPPGAGQPRQLRSLARTSLHSPSPAGRARAQGLASPGPRQPHPCSLQRSPPPPSPWMSWDVLRVSDVGDWSLPRPQPEFHLEYSPHPPPLPQCRGRCDILTGQQKGTCSSRDKPI